MKIVSRVMVVVLMLVGSFSSQSQTTFTWWPTNLFSTDLEKNDLGEFWKVTNGGCSLILSSNLSYSGMHSLRAFCPATNTTRTCYVTRKMDIPQHAYDLTNFYRDELYIRTMFYLDQPTLVNGDSVQILCPGRTGYGSIAGAALKRTTTNYIIRCSTVGDGTNAVTTNSWHCLDFHLKNSTGGGSDSNGVLECWLDNVLTVSSTNLGVTNQFNEIRVGTTTGLFAGSSNSKLDVYYDDIWSGTNQPGYSLTNVSIKIPEPNSRIGMPGIVVLSGCNTGETLWVSLTSAGGTNSPVFYGSCPSAMRQDVMVNLRGLAADTYTLQAVVTNSGSMLCSNGMTWTKTYSGDPKFSVDEWNRFTSNGVPFFPIGPFVLDTSDVETWTTNGAINISMGGDWNDRSAAGNDVCALTAATNGIWYFGGYPWTNSPYKYTNEPGNKAVTTNDVLVVITNMTTTNCVGYMIIDEPENYYFPGSVVKQLWDAAKAFDTSKPVHLNFMGGTFKGTDSWTELFQDYAYPRMCGDFYGFDLYPVEYAATQSFPEMYLNEVNIRVWNHDLVPTFQYVQTQDVALGGGGMPTTNQIYAMSWIPVVAGARMIQWYHYAGATPASSIILCSKFARDLSAYSQILLSTNLPTWPIYGYAGETNLVSSMRSFGGTNWAFSVNCSSNTLSASVPYSWFLNNHIWKRISILSGQTSNIYSSTGTIDDSFTGYEVVAYQDTGTFQGRVASVVNLRAVNVHAP